MSIITTRIDSLRLACTRWVQETYGDKSLFDVKNRAMRVAEEGVELAQAEDVTREQMLAIVERAYSRPAGEPRQEFAGVGFTWLVYSYAKHMVDPVQPVIDELRRVETIDSEYFRAKHREKFAAGTDISEPV